MSVSLQSCHKGALTPTCFNLTWAQNSCIETHEFCIHCLEMSLIAVTSSELRQVAKQIYDLVLAQVQPERWKKEQKGFEEKTVATV